MGSNMSSYPSMSAAVTTEIQTPADFVWDMLLQIDDYPEIFANIQSVERVAGYEKVQVGCRWKETRQFQGHTIVMTKTITEVVEKESCCISVTLDNKNSSNLMWWTNNDAETATLIFQPLSKTSCEIILSFAYSSSSCWGRFLLSLCGCCILKYGKTYMESEVNDVKVAAEKRFRASSGTGMQ